MDLERKLKETVLDIALKQALKTRHPSRKRIARNLVDMGLSLSGLSKSEAEKKSLEEGLLNLLEQGGQDDIELFVMEHFSKAQGGP